MFCPQCGHQTENNVQYCSQCGAKLPPVSDSNAKDTDPEDKRPKSGGSTPITQSLENSGQDAGEAVVSKKFFIGILIATAFIPLVGVVMGILYLRKELPEEKKAGKTWLITGIGFMILNAIILSMNN